MKKKIHVIMKNENFFFLEKKNFDGLMPILWTGHAGAQAGAGRAAGLRRQGRWAWVQAVGAQAWGGWACVLGVQGALAAGGRSWGAGVRRRAARHGRAERWRGARARGRASGRAAVTRGARMGERYCSSDTTDPGSDTAGPRATIRPLCAPGCAQLGQIWVLGTLTRFFALFDLLSHQMNTVHCEINFSKKKNIFF